MLINCGFYGNLRNSGLALYLKMLLSWCPLSVCQISCLYLQVHNLPEISSYAAGLKFFLPNLNITTLKVFLRNLVLKFLMDIKAMKLTRLSHFSIFFARPLTRGFHLLEVKNIEFGDITGTVVCLPYGRCPLRGVL